MSFWRTADCYDSKINYLANEEWLETLKLFTDLEGLNAFRTSWTFDAFKKPVERSLETLSLQKYLLGRL